MKKVTILALILIALTGCQQPPSEVITGEDASTPNQTEELENEISKLKEQLEQRELQNEIEELQNELNQEEEEEVKVPEYTGPNFITIDTPKHNEHFTEEPISFIGSVSPNAEKIVVTATKFTWGDETDIYTLQNFNTGDTTFKYGASQEWGNLGMGTNNYEFTAYYPDNTTKTANLTIFMNLGGAEMGKPVVYLYPETTQEIFVNVEPTHGISISDPEIKDGWNVIATPESTIFNKDDNKIYPYLFWEGFSADMDTPEEGFMVKNKNVDKFFDEKLAKLGLNKTEIKDFKEYWVPILSEDPYYFITFIPQDEFDEYAPLTVVPKPDTTIRVFFDYEGLQTPRKVTEQKLVTPERNGFVVTEWGGRIYR